MCKVLQVYRSGYYAWLKRPDSARKQWRRKVTQRIHAIFLSSRRLYGSPKITQILRHEGIRVSQKTVARILRECGLKSRTVRSAQIQGDDELETQSSSARECTQLNVS